MYTVYMQKVISFESDNKVEQDIYREVVFINNWDLDEKFIVLTCLSGDSIIIKKEQIDFIKKEADSE